MRLEIRMPQRLETRDRSHGRKVLHGPCQAEQQTDLVMLFASHDCKAQDSPMHQKDFGRKTCLIVKWSDRLLFRSISRSFVLIHPDYTANGFGIIQQGLISDTGCKLHAGAHVLPSRNQDISSAMSQIFTLDAELGTHYLLTDIPLPSNPAIQKFLVLSPQSERISIPSALIKAWLLALNDIPAQILLPCPGL